MSRVLGLKDLIVDAVAHTTTLVQDTHASVTRRVVAVAALVPPLREPVAQVAAVEELAAGAVYATIRATTRAVGGVVGMGIVATGADELEDAVVPLRSDAVGSAIWVGDAALGLVNGIVGDFLHTHDNGLQLAMQLRHRDARAGGDLATLSAPQPGVDAVASGRLCVFVHGLAATEWSWSVDAETNHGAADADFGRLLERDLGVASLYLRYNSGRRVADNAAELSRLLERLIASWPVEVESIVLIGHSMGGLVARCAAAHGHDQGAAWIGALRHVFCLGAPHEGAPLEKLGELVTQVLDAVDLPATQVIARVLGTRSAGIRDLHSGEHAGVVGARSVDGVAYVHIAATMTDDPEHPMGVAFGDGLVRVPSACSDEDAEVVVIGALGHLGLANDPRVYQAIASRLADDG
jgi:triacylglycerol lipase